MNKKYLSLFIFFLLVIVGILLKEDSVQEVSIVHKVPEENIRPLDEREINAKLEESSETTEAALDQEFVSPEEEPWEENVRIQLKRQAFVEGVEVNITKESSLFWEEMGTPIEASTVRVQLRSPAGETTSFRALIDSNNGKILRTWDRPVIDPINPRERSGIKINPLYHTR